MESELSFKTKDRHGYKEVEVFENQRLRPLFGWGSSGYLLHIDPSPFSDESGEVNCDASSISDIKAPAGFEWATDWKICRNHTATDENGWSYASSFWRLLARYKAHSSSDHRAPHHVTRRRMWRRIARPIYLPHHSEAGVAHSLKVSNITCMPYPLPLYTIS